MAQDRVCAIDGCNKRVKTRGWCSAHYAMWQRHGDPTVRTVIEHGKPLAWLMAHVRHSGEECLVWPFGGNGNGYGQIRYQAKKGLPHRIMCMMAHGAAPSPAHQAAHSCGNRECVNPGHLRWRDQSGNEADKVVHGRDIRGEKHPLAKLTKDDVLSIRALDGVMTHKEISEIFGVTDGHVGRLIKRQEWCWLA
jgi:hypothetical protein